MIENFVLMELAQLTWSDERAGFITTEPETRSRSTPCSKLQTAAELRHLERQVGDRFVAGYVLYTGQQTLPFGERLRALPVEALWQVRP